MRSIKVPALLIIMLFLLTGCSHSSKAETEKADAAAIPTITVNQETAAEETEPLVIQDTQATVSMEDVGNDDAICKKIVVNAEKENNELNTTSDNLVVKPIEIGESGKNMESQENTSTPEEPSDSDFVKVSDYIPNIVVELRYATENNFTGQVIYQFTDAYLRFGTVKKLKKAQGALEGEGFRLKIWDGFRPTSAQFALWKLFPDERYVSNPNKGFSSHSRGNTVDITVVDLDGNEVAMPSEFDDFSKLADRNYSDIEPVAAENAKRLERIMKECGFSAYYEEWWHYSDTTYYNVDKSFSP